MNGSTFSFKQRIKALRELDSPTVIWKKQRAIEDFSTSTPTPTPTPTLTEIPTVTITLSLFGPTETPTETSTETPTETSTETPTETQTSTEMPSLSTFYAAGYNYDGELGLGYGEINQTPFTEVSGNWSFVACGFGHTCALSGNKLYVTGENIYGELGLGDTNPRYSFTEVPGTWSAVACSRYYTLALSGNKMFAAGSNSGQFGLGDYDDRLTFTEVPGNWDAISCGRTHAFALSGNKLFASGSNGQGQLGLGDTSSRTTFTEVPGNWDKVFCGYANTFALSGNTYFATGDNSYGILGLGDPPFFVNRTTFTEVSGTWDTVVPARMATYALSSNKLFVVGYGYAGLGFGNMYEQANKFTQLSGTWNNVSVAQDGPGHVLALSGDKLFGLGENWAYQLGYNSGTTFVTGSFVEVPGSWSEAVCGSYHTFARAVSPLIITSTPTETPTSSIPTPTETPTPTTTPTQTPTPGYIGGFQGPYAPINWTFGVHGNGTIISSTAPTSITLVGSNDSGVGGSLNTDFTITALSAGLVSFDWYYQTQDSEPQYDPGGYLINGSFVQLPNPTGSTTQSGTSSFTVLYGQVFGFRVNTIDDMYGKASLTISNFAFQAS